MRSIIERHQNPIMGTATFHENVTDKKEASLRWRRVLERIRRHFKEKGERVELAGAWQRQERGAWHPHFICSRPLDVNWFREVLVACGFGVQCRLDFVLPHNGFRHVGSRYAVNYIGRYVTRDFSDAPDAKGARLTFYFQTVHGTCRGWAFAQGLSKLHRLGCRAIFGPEQDFVPGGLNGSKMRMTGRLPSLWRNGRWLDAFEQWKFLVMAGWNTLHKIQQDGLFEISRGVQWFLVEQGLVEAPF
jgi:hypothetical protein